MTDEKRYWDFNVLVYATYAEAEAMFDRLCDLLCEHDPHDFEACKVLTASMKRDELADLAATSQELGEYE